LPIFTVEGCIGARKQGMKIFLYFDEAKTSQLDKQYRYLFWTMPVCMAASANS
jgi:hypothetical protein